MQSRTDLVFSQMLKISEFNTKKIKNGKSKEKGSRSSNGVSTITRGSSREQKRAGCPLTFY
jgi:hypothetical protein